MKTAQFEGRGVYYAATLNEVKECASAEVAVVGGGNSAGQAAVFLASHARKVVLLVRGDDLHKNMSSYLAHRIEGTPNIDVQCNCAIRRMAGDNHLTEIEISNTKTGQTRTMATPAVFSFIGATPRTDWLPAEIERDAKGFVRTGAEVAQSPHWPAPPAVLAGNEPAGRVRGRGCAVRVGQAGRLRRRRGGDGGAIRA